MATPAVRQGLRFLEDLRWVRIYNDSGSTIPAFGLIRVTGSVTQNGQDTGILKVSTPNADGQHVLVNSMRPLAAGKYGRATSGAPIYVHYDTADGTPAIGEIWGAGNASFKARKNKPGFTVYGSAGNERVMVQRPQQQGLTFSTAAGTAYGPRNLLDFTAGTGIVLTGTDTPASNKYVLDIAGGVKVRKNSGTTYGPRARLNIVDSGDISVALTDSAGSDEVEVAFTYTGSSGSGGGVGSRRWVDSDQWYVGGVDEYAQIGAGSITLTSNDTIYLYPFMSPRGGTVDRIGIDVYTAATAGKKMVLGIYEENSSTDPRPHALVVASSEQAIDATGVITATISEALSATKCYWLAMVHNSTTVDFRYVITSTGQSALWSPLGHELSGGSFATTPPHYLTYAHTYDATLPDPLTVSSLASATDSIGFPAIFYRYSA